MCKNVICAGNKNKKFTLFKVTPIPGDVQSKYSWAKPYQCSICNATYYICQRCQLNKSVTSMFIKSRLRRHHLQHNECEQPELPKYRSTKRKHTNLDNLSCNNLNITGIGNHMKEPMSPYLFDRAESYKYFTYNEKYGKGPASIVSNALFGTSNAYEHMNEDDITLHLLIAKFVKTLSRIQQVQFSYIMEMLHDKHQSTDEIQYATTVQTNFCKTDAELRSAYVEVKASIVNNLP